MGLDFSQRQLLNKPLHYGKRTAHLKRTERLQVYAVLTGFLSIFVSLATLVIRILQ